MPKRRFLPAAAFPSAAHLERPTNEIINAQFNYFPREKVQLTVLKNIDREFQPTTAPVYGQPIVFDIQQTVHNFIDLSRSSFNVRGQITDADGTAIGGGEHVGTCNLFGHSIFSDILIEVGGKLINQNTNGLYPYRAYLETLLSLEEEPKNTFYQMEGWYKDTPAQIGQANPNAVVANRNVGLFKRMEKFAGGNSYQFMLRPHLDICHQHRAIPSNTRLRFTLNPSRNSFLLKTEDPGVDAHDVAIPQVQYQFRIREITFICDTLQMVPEAEAALYSYMLKGNNLIFPMRRVEVKQLTITPNQAVHNFERVFNGILPDRMIIGLVEQSWKDGHFQQNPFNFQHFNLNYVAVYINGELFDGKALKPDFREASRNTLEAYKSLYRAMGNDFINKSIGISYEEYHQGFVLYGYDLTPDGSAGTGPTSLREGNLRIELGFRELPARALTLIVYAEQPSRMEIDARGEAIYPA